MAVCVHQDVHFDRRRCPKCFARHRDQKYFDQALKKNLLYMLAALPIYLIACGVYRLVENTPIVYLGIGIWFLPIFLNAFKATRRSRFALVSSVPTWSCLCLFGLSGLIIANGALDRSAATQKACVVAGKDIAYGRSGNSYHLIVQCEFTAGTKNLSVDRQTYRLAQKGQLVSIELHKGLFGLEWYRGVKP